MPALFQLFAVLLLGVGISSSRGSDNLIPNPSFEDPVGKGMTESDWRFSPLIIEGQKPGRGVYSNDEALAHTGPACMMIEGGVGAWHSPTIEGKSNTPYHLTAWVKGEGNTEGGASLAVQSFLVDGKLGPVCGFPIQLSSEWQQVDMGFVSEPDVVSFRIDLNSMSSGKVWFDDVSLVEDVEGSSLPKVSVWHFPFEGEKPLDGWNKTQGASVTPLGDHIEIQGADWNSLIYRMLNLRAGRYRLSGSGAGQAIVIASKEWQVSKRIQMVNLSGRDFRSDERTFDFPGGQLLLIVQANGENAIAKIQWVEIALESLEAPTSPGTNK